VCTIWGITGTSVAGGNRGGGAGVGGISAALRACAAAARVRFERSSSMLATMATTAGSRSERRRDIAWCSARTEPVNSTEVLASVSDAWASSSCFCCRTRLASLSSSRDSSIVFPAFLFELAIHFLWPLMRVHARLMYASAFWYEMSFVSSADSFASHHSASRLWRAFSARSVADPAAVARSMIAFRAPICSSTRDAVRRMSSTVASRTSSGRRVWNPLMSSGRVVRPGERPGEPYGSCGALRPIARVPKCTTARDAV
jgi:hypothetical protein